MSSANLSLTDCVSAASMYGVAVAGLRRLVSVAMRLSLGGPYNAAPAKRRSRAELYMLSTLNCALCVGVALKILLQRQTKSSDERAAWECAVVTSLGKLELGYYLHDLIAILPQCREHPADVFHHVCGLVMMSLTLNQLDSLHEFVAPMLLVDASTIALNLLWFQREFKVGTSQTRRLQLLFASMFFVLRVLWLPAFLYQKRRDEPEKFSALGCAGEATLSCIVLLQLYWFSLIAAKFLRGK